MLYFCFVFCFGFVSSLVRLPLENRMYWIMILFRLLLLRVGVFFASSFFVKLRRRYARVPC